MIITKTSFFQPLLETDKGATLIKNYSRTKHVLIFEEHKIHNEIIKFWRAAAVLSNASRMLVKQEETNACLNSTETDDVARLIYYFMTRELVPNAAGNLWLYKSGNTTIVAWSFITIGH